MKKSGKSIGVMTAVILLCAAGIALVILGICGKGKPELMLPLGAVCVSFANCISIFFSRARRNGKDG